MGLCSNAGKGLSLLPLIMALVFIFFVTSAHAEDPTSRKGFYLAGIGFVGSETLQTKRFSAGVGARIGGGITEKVLLYVEAQGSFIDQSTLSNLLIFDGQLKGHYYIWEGLYANLGSGVSVGRVQTATILISSAKTGFGISGGVGYEFRVSKRFFVSPEFQLRYQRLAATNYLTPAVGGQIGWHF